MKPTTIAVISAAILAGFGAGYLFRPAPEDDTPPAAPASKQETTKKQASNSTTAPEERNTPRTASKRSAEPAEETSQEPEEQTREERRAAFRQQFTQTLVDRQQKTFDSKVEALVEKLGLSPEQAVLLKAHYSSKLEAYKELMGEGMQNMRSLEGMNKLSATLGDQDLDAALAGILDQDQKGAYEEIKTRERVNKVESSAMKQMASLQSSLDLDDTQKDAVYEILYKEAEQKVDQNSPIKSMMDAFGAGAMVVGDTSAIEKSLAIQTDENLSAEEKKAQIEAIHEASLEQQVRRFDGILTQTQQKQYRQQLESQSQWMRGFGGRGRGSR